MASGVIMLIFSFLAFYKIDGSDINSDDLSWSGWSSAVNLFPIVPVTVLIAVLLAAQVAATRFAGTSLPDRVFGYSWRDLRLLAGAIGVLVMLCYLLRSFDLGVDVSKGIGLWLCLLGSIGFLVGAFMERSEDGGAALSDGAEPKRSAPSPADFAILGGGAVILIASFLHVYAEDGQSVKAWDSPLFPLYILPVLFGVVMAAQVALTTFANVRIPERIFGIEWNRIHLALGGWAAFMMVAFLIGHVAFTADGVETNDPGKGIGYWLMLVAALALAAGAFMRLQEAGRPAAPAAPAGNPPPPPPPPA